MNIKLKIPLECENLQEIRQGIDFIDHQIVQLLSQRMDYVLSAARFKPDQASIAAPERVKVMLSKRRKWADEERLSADYIESLFTKIIEWYISEQTKHWLKQR